MCRHVLACCLALFLTPLTLVAEGILPPPVSAEGSGWRLDISQRAAVRLLYQVRYRATPLSGYWRGSVADCVPGELLAAHRADLLDRLNLFRALAGVPADLVEDPAASRKIQAAALAVAANGRIAHQIDPGWRCYSEEARTGAADAVLGIGQSGPDAITVFMRDAGEQNAGVNHRRWLLYPQTHFVGLGDIPPNSGRRAASGVSAFDGLYAGNRPAVRDDFVAWPPPGWVPYPLVFPRWSLSLPDADFSAATVSLAVDGQAVPLIQEPVETGAGEPALVWRPRELASDVAWPRPMVDRDYRVEIHGVVQAGKQRDISYVVHIFDPERPGTEGELEARVAGPARVTLEGSDFNLSLPPGATGAQWRALRVAGWPLQEGAEQGYGAFAYTGANDYPVLQQQVVSEGRQAFRLAHRHIGDEVLLLAEPLLADTHTVLRFRQRLGLAGAGEEARVEVRVVGQADWVPLYQRAGGLPTAADKQFNEQRVELGRYAGRLLELRFRYRFAEGDFFAPDDERVGWYLDDIRLDAANRILSWGEPRDATAGFRFRPAMVGMWRLQARPTVYRAPGDWGPLWPVSVE